MQFFNNFAVFYIKQKHSKRMKISTAWKSIIIVSVIIVFDQALKIWIKTNMEHGESFSVFGNWFLIHFIENPGMAFGWKFGGKAGKLFLSIFRLLAIVAFTWYLVKIIKEKAPQGFIISVSLVLAGAIGNMIDCAFYGLIFDTGTTFNVETGEYDYYYNSISKFSLDGYATFLHGCVVDMLSFPIFEGFYPEWLPILGGKRFVFFGPIFNIADSAVTTGVLSIVIFYWGYLKKVEYS